MEPETVGKSELDEIPPETCGNCFGRRFTSILKTWIAFGIAFFGVSTLLVAAVTACVLIFK